MKNKLKEKIHPCFKPKKSLYTLPKNEAGLGVRHAVEFFYGDISKGHNTKPIWTARLIVIELFVDNHLKTLIDGGIFKTAGKAELWCHNMQKVLGTNYDVRL